MKILDDLIAALDVDAPVRDIRQGIFHTAVLSRHCGLAATLPRDALKQDEATVREAGTLLSRSVQELVKMAYSDRILEASLGMAAINSLIQVDEAACIELNAADLILEKGEGRKVVVVGHFPFLPRVREKAETLWVIEKNPKDGDLEEAEAERVIPQAHVVALTGTSLTTHTLEHLLGLCDPKAFVLMLGDTVPLSPILFDYGVHALSGTRVIDEHLAMACVSQGANFRQIRGTKRLTMFKR